MTKPSLNEVRESQQNAPGNFWEGRTFEQGHVELESFTRTIQETAQVGLRTSKEEAKKANVQFFQANLGATAVFVHFLLRLLAFIIHLILQASATLRGTVFNEAKAKHAKVAKRAEIEDFFIGSSSFNGSL